MEFGRPHRDDVLHQQSDLRVGYSPPLASLVLLGCIRSTIFANRPATGQNAVSPPSLSPTQVGSGQKAGALSLPQSRVHDGGSVCVAIRYHDVVRESCFVPCREEACRWQRITHEIWVPGKTGGVMVTGACARVPGPKKSPVEPCQGTRLQIRACLLR